MIYALLSTVAVALLSLLGVFLFGKQSHAITHNRFILPFAVGTFLSVVFFELIPEVFHEAPAYASLAIASGFLFFYALAHMLRTYHHHHGESCGHGDTRAAASLVLAGDAIHNIADGVVIAAAFMVSPAVGVVTTLGIALHEIPQEIAEYGILLRAGYSRMRAALYNLLSASSIIVGVLIAFLSLSFAEGFLGILLGIAAGNLLYIAASDIIPNLHEEHAPRSSFWKSFAATVFAMVLMSTLLAYTHGQSAHEEEHTEADTQIYHD